MVNEVEAARPWKAEDGDDDNAYHDICYIRSHTGHDSRVILSCQHSSILLNAPRDFELATLCDLKLLNVRAISPSHIGKLLKIHVATDMSNICHKQKKKLTMYCALPTDCITLSRCKTDKPILDWLKITVVF